MTHGSCMEIPLGSGRGGIRILDCFLQVRELRLVSALESASLEGMAGAGTTGVMIGIITAFFSTTTATYPTAEFSSIATTSIAPADFMAVDFTAAALPAGEVSARRSMGSRHHTPSQVRIPVHSAALIMEESREAFPHGGSRASVEVFTVAAVVTLAVVTGNSVALLQRQVTTRRAKSCVLQI